MSGGKPAGPGSTCCGVYSGCIARTRPPPWMAWSCSAVAAGRSGHGRGCSCAPGNGVAHGGAVAGGALTDCALPACDRPVSDAWVCAPCAATIAGRLKAAAELWPDLLATCAGQARMGEPGPRARGHAPPQPIRPGLGDPADDHQVGPPTGLPFGWTATNVRDSVRNTVTTWVRHIVAERPTGMLLGSTPTLLRWLAGQCEWLRHQRYGPEALDELDDAAGMVAPAVDRPAMRTRVAVGPCPEANCTGQVTALVPARLDIPAVMRCDGCGSEWGAQQWARVGRRIMARMERMGA